jgi:hypothetical protein
MAYLQIEEEAQLEGLRAETKASFGALLAARDGQLAEKRKSNGPAGDRWKRAESRLRDAEEKRRAVFAKLQRLTDAKRISGYWALVIAIGLATLEAPINKFMLDNILRGNNIDSYAISLFMTFITLGLAHIGGYLARQIRGAYHETIYVGNIIGVIGILIVLATWVGALTIGRAFYSVAGPTSLGSGIFSEITRQVVTIGPWTAFTKALSDQTAFFLACLNTAGIAFVGLLAFITHDSDRVYQSSLDEAEKAGRVLTKLENKYNRAVEKIAKKYSLKLGIAAATYGAQNAQIVALKRSRGADLTDEDTFDLNSLDTMLTEAREELAHKSRNATHQDKHFVESAPKLGDNGLNGGAYAERERT